jgi:hypothetical protein
VAIACLNATESTDAFAQDTYAENSRGVIYLLDRFTLHDIISRSYPR